MSPDGAWNDLYTAPMFDKSGDSYLMILPGKQGSEGFYKVRDRSYILLLAIGRKLGTSVKCIYFPFASTKIEKANLTNHNW